MDHHLLLMGKAWAAKGAAVAGGRGTAVLGVWLEPLLLAEGWLEVICGRKRKIRTNRGQVNGGSVIMRGSHGSLREGSIGIASFIWSGCQVGGGGT